MTKRPPRKRGRGQAVLPGFDDGLGPGRPRPPARSRASSRRAPLADHFEGLTRPQRPVGIGLVFEQDAVFGQGRGKRLIASVSRPHRQGGPRASSWATRSMSSGGRLRTRRGPGQLAAVRRPLRPTLKGPPGPGTALWTRRLAEAAGPRSAKSSSWATSRPTRSPGLTITSSHRRLAGGRYQARRCARQAYGKRAEEGHPHPCVA